MIHTGQILSNRQAMDGVGDLLRQVPDGGNSPSVALFGQQAVEWLASLGGKVTRYAYNGLPDNLTAVTLTRDGVRWSAQATGEWLMRPAPTPEDPADQVAPC